jgi:pimeloyl-ACP methyl ester carboxylesterase
MNARPDLSPFEVAILPIPAQVPAREGLADLGDVRLWYWDTGGDGEPLVLLHAVVGSGAMWLYQQPVFAAAGYRVVGYSRRGHFGSDPGPADRPGSAAGDLAALMDLLGIERAHIVGTAAGGFCAADFALAHGQRVKTLTLATSLVAVGDAEFMQRTGAMRPHAFESYPPEFRELGPAYRFANPAGTAAWLKLVGEARPVVVTQAYASPLSLAALEALDMPVQLLTSDADPYAPPPVMKSLADRISGAELKLIAGAGHSAYWEQPEAFNRAVLDFIAQHGG